MSYIGVNADWLKQHDTEIREKVLDELVRFRIIANVKIEDETPGNYYTRGDAWREFELLLEKLRQEGKDGE